MNILSIDVGMKNLGCCLFTVNGDMNYIIDSWEVLNLCNTQIHYCGEINSKKNIKCVKKAKYTKNNKYFCKIHAKNKNFKIPPSELSIKKINKFKITSLKEIANKYEFLFEKKDKKDIIKQKIINCLEKDYFDVVTTSNTNDFNLVYYGRNLKKEFNIFLENKKIDIVIVENQIGPKAMRMKTLQGMIMQHFIERDIPLVEEISASNKLKEFLGNTKTTYSERKKASIKITRQILNESNFLNKWLEPFISHKKKDDMADSFLQGRWYLKNTIFKEKIN
jgi:hypothetical protein